MPSPTQETCKIPGCARLADGARGMCQAHYTRWRKGIRGSSLEDPIRTHAGATRTAPPEKQCGIPDCTRPIKTKGLCRSHYRLYLLGLRGDDLNRPIREQASRKDSQGNTLTCKITGCKEPVHVKGYCQGHHSRWVSGVRGPDLEKPIIRHGTPKPICSAAGCNRETTSHTTRYCGVHLGRWNRGLRGSELEAPIKSPTGEPYQHKNGYMVRCIDRKQVYEHRYIMEQHLGRPMRKDENVHHKDGDRTNNHIDNLELWTRCQPYGQRVKDKVRWAEQYLDRYRDEIDRGLIEKAGKPVPVMPARGLDDTDGLLPERCGEAREVWPPSKKKVKIDENGYAYMTFAGKDVKVHTLVMAQHLGRRLRPNENVHHKNGDRADNRIDNLELWERSQPQGQRVTDMAAYAADILRHYRPLVCAGRI